MGDLTQVVIKRVLFTVGALVLVGCSSVNVKQTSIPALKTVFSGVVENRVKVILEPNESLVGRVAIGLAVAGPVGAVATAVTEDDFSEPGAYRYRIRQSDGVQKSLVSRSIVEIGRCVEVLSPNDSDFDVLMVKTPERCSEAATVADFIE